MLFLWLMLTILFILSSEYLLITLLLLETMTFFIMYYLSLSVSAFILSDFLILSFFTVFVMEGVIALAGLIMLVSFIGTDYVSSSSLLK